MIKEIGEFTDPIPVTGGIQGRLFRNILIFSGRTEA